jgi:heavy metal sensor kinase
MSLATRLSAFFLAALACVLVGFSVSLYVLARGHLYRQADVRVRAALDILLATAEMEPDGLDWEPPQRLQRLGEGAPPDAVCWAVTDGKGELVDGSANDEAARFFAAADVPGEGDSSSGQDVRFGDGTWLVVRHTLRHKGDVPAPQPGGPRRYAALVVTAAIPLANVQEQLRRLALLLAGLSAGLWLTAAVVGRQLCRRALRPLTGMAGAARAITAADLGRRLPSAGTGDELEELGGAFNDLLGRLQESFERQRRFTGDASHQLRTPLTAVLGQIDVALRRQRDPEEYRRVLRAVQGQALHLGRIVEALLFLARADAEALAPGREATDLRPWLRERLASWSAHPRAADIRPDIPDGPPLEVDVHAPLLAQAVDNLLENACKYSEPGSPVRLRAWQEPARVCVSVEDRGRGIAADDLPHIFEPFYRSKQSRELGVAGLGLGLAVAARAVRALGGRITAKSQPGQGSLFTIELPRRAPVADKDHAPQVQ